MAILLAQKGARITVSDLNLATAEETVKIIDSKWQAQAIQLNVANMEEIIRAHKEAKKEFGMVDILINNAGVTFGKQNYLFTFL